MMNSGLLRKERFQAVFAAVVVVVVFFVYPMTVDIPLLDPDEGLHASIAQEMVERGDWLCPRFLSKPFLDKPVLYFWMEALSLRLFGMHEAAVRFPGLMFGLLGVVTTGILGWRMFDRRTGYIAGLFYATTILPVSLAQAASHDVALIPWVNLALLLFWESHQATTRKALLGCTGLIGVILGLAVLTKGLVGVAIVGVAYGAFLLTTRRLTLAVCGRGAATLAIAAVIAAPWYVGMELRSPGYLYYWFVERHLMGYLATEQFHGNESWWYYLPILLGGGLPWILYLPVIGQDEWLRRKASADTDTRNAGRQGSQSSGAIALLWCWLIAGTLFLTGAHSKTATYVWPLFPAVALLGAVAWSRLLNGTLSQSARRTLSRTFLLGCGAGSLALPIAMSVVQRKYDVQYSWEIWSAGILLALALWVPFALHGVQRPRSSLLVAILSLAAHFAFIMTIIVPFLAQNITGRDLAGYFNRLGSVPHRLVFADDRIASFVFYLDPDLRAGLQDGQLQETSMGGLPEDGSDTIIAVPLKRAGQADQCQRLAKWTYQKIGHYRVYELRPDG